MPPDSDTIVVQQPGIRLPSPNPCDQPADEMDVEESQSTDDEEQDLATPTQNTATQPNIFEIPILPPNKRQANFSPEILHRGKNLFQNINTRKPIAKDSEQAIYWARDLILQASTMAQSHVSQNKLLELLDVFRDFTEKGRVTNQITDKLSTQLAYHSATLTTASQQATKTIKNAVYLATQKTTNQPKVTSTDTSKNQTKSSYATIAAQNKTATWTTVLPKKKQNTKKPNSYYQVVLTLLQTQPADPLQARNKVNEAFAKAGIEGPVIQAVTTSRKNNLILTTTAKYSGDFLLQNKNVWQELFPLAKAQLLESWTKVIVHNVPTTFEGAENLEILRSEVPTYNMGLQIVGNPYWLSRNWQDKANSSVVIAFKTEEEARKLGARITILGQNLLTEKYRATPATTQCLNCQAFEELGRAIKDNQVLQNMAKINDPRKIDSKNLLLNEDYELRLQLEEIREAITQVIQKQRCQQASQAGLILIDCRSQTI
ncbi:hypothetical protein A1F97_10925 [Pyrenophora tritici-repentis]|nr:hypothetical protein A1F97_10925 [Pyrenophora tritici-repentis]